MCVSVVSSIRSSTLHRTYRTAEDRSGEVFYLVHDAGTMALSVEGEGKQTGGLYAVSDISPTRAKFCPADLGSDLRDVTLTSETGRVRVSRWFVVHVVLSCHPGQVARQPGVDCRIL